MDAKLFAQAIGKFLAGLVITALLVFVPAGTADYRNGWIFIILLFAPMFAAGLVMMFR